MQERLYKGMDDNIDLIKVAIPTSDKAFHRQADILLVILS